MAETNLNKISPNELDQGKKDVANVLNGMGDKSYQTAIGQLFKILGDGFAKLSNDLKQTINQLKELEMTRSGVLSSFDKDDITASVLGKNMNQIALNKADNISKSSSLESELKNILEQNRPISENSGESSPSLNNNDGFLEKLKNDYDQKEELYGKHVEKMLSLQALFEADIITLTQKKDEAETEAEKKKYNDALVARSDSHQASLLQMMFENQDFSAVLEKDLSQLSRRAQKTAIKESEAAIKNARKFLDTKRSEIGKNSPELSNELNNLEKQVDTAEEKTAEAKTKVKKFSPDKDIQGDLNAVAGCFKTCADAVRHFNAPLADSFEIVAGIASGAGEIVGGIATMGANPIQGVASIAKGVMGVVGMFAKRNAENQAIKKEYELQQTQLYNSGLEYNKLLRERLRLEKEVGETSLQYFKRKELELNKQKQDIAQESQAVLKKLQGEQYTSGTELIHKTWFRKARVKENKSSLAGKSYDQIEKFYVEGKLEGEAKLLFERLQALKKEGQDVEKMIKDLEVEMQEAWTGTKSSTIVDSIAKGFMDGKKSAKDFAEDFEDMMRSAMTQAIKMKYLDKELDGWYAKFAEYSESGEELTKEEIDELRKSYNMIIENTNNQIVAMEEVTGISLSKKNGPESVAQQGLAAISQDSANQLNGSFNTLNVHTFNINEKVGSIQSDLHAAADRWKEIAENTYYCRRLEDIQKDMNYMKNDISSIALKGIRLLN